MSIHALVVDDDERIIDDVQERLESLGHTYDCVRTQQEAREHLDSTSYSYILLDLGLPVTFGRSARVENGLNLLNEISEARRLEAPILVMTAHGQDGPDLAVEVLRYGRAIDFIKKPFASNAESFETKVTRALERAATRGTGIAAVLRARESSRDQPAERFEGRCPGLRWEEIVLSIRDGHTLSVKVRGESRIYNFAQLGLGDRRSGNPTVQWELLRSIAESNGVLDWTSRGADRRNQKRRERLARDLMSFFGIEEDPFRLTGDGKGWIAKFSLAIA